MGHETQTTQIETTVRKAASVTINLARIIAVVTMQRRQTTQQHVYRQKQQQQQDHLLLEKRQLQLTLIRPILRLN